MHADPELRGEAVHATVFRERALDRDGSRRGGGYIIERREESVARGLHDLAVMFPNQPPQHVVVPAPDVTPRLVAHRLEEVRRTDDIREDEGAYDSAADIVGRRRPQELLAARSLQHRAHAS